MADKNKDELVADAKAAGIDNADSLRKAELVDRLGEHDTAAAGAYVPEGELQPSAIERNEKPVTGIQPLEDSDIPDAGR